MATSSINLMSATTIQELSVAQASVSTAGVDMLTGEANKLYRVEQLSLANKTSAAITATVTATIGGVSAQVVSGISIPAYSTLYAIDRNFKLSLTGTGEKVNVKAGTATALDAVLNYKVIA